MAEEKKMTLNGREIEYEPAYAKECAKEFNKKMDELYSIVDDMRSAIATLEMEQGNLDHFSAQQIMDEWKGVPEFDQNIKFNDEDKKTLELAAKYEAGDYLN